VRLLTGDGSLWVLINDEHAAHFAIMLQEAGLCRRSWIKWYETFGVNCRRKFNRTSRHLFHCTRHPRRFIFHAEAVNRPSARLAVYRDKRANPAGKNWDDVWGIDPPIPRLTGTCAERIQGFPTQLPLALLRPVVGCASDPDDLILDPFAGSCTTGVAAIEAGRRFIGIEREARFVELAGDRLLRAAGKACEVLPA
jgi:site-specific DNA-methyltransferase (adenine-specific)